MGIFIWALFILAITINLVTLHNGHNWGDDFAQYIINARNIVEVKPYTSGIMLDNGDITPPGFPLLLAPLLKIFGLNFKVLKILNVFSWFLSVFLIYAILIKKEGKKLAMMAVVFLAFSSNFFIFKQNVLSDVPFFLFVCLSFYAFDRWDNYNSKREGRLFFILFLLSISFALWVRTCGSILFVSALFYFIFIKRDLRLFMVVLAVFCINGIFLFFLLGSRPSVLIDIYQTPYVFLNNVFHNFPTVFRSLWCFFCPSQTIYSRALCNSIDPLVSLAAPVIYILIIGSFITGYLKKTLSFLEIFSFFYFTLLILWAWVNMSPQGFARYTLPVLPFIFIEFSKFLVFMKGFKLDCYGLVRVVFLVLLLVNVSNVIITWNFDDDVFNVPENSELINWVRQNMKPDEHFMYWKPRALALFTQRVGTAPWVYPDQKQGFIQRVKTLKISYIFTGKRSDTQSLTALLEGSRQFKLIWENNRYKIFKFIG